MLTTTQESTDEVGIRSDFAALLYADPWPIAVSIATAVLMCAVLAIGLPAVVAAGWGALAALAHLAHLALWRA